MRFGNRRIRMNVVQLKIIFTGQLINTFCLRIFCDDNACVRTSSLLTFVLVLFTNILLQSPRAHLHVVVLIWFI